MPKSLLLADDSITIQRVVGITFANEDFEITTVDNGEDAINKAKEMNPDIILADVIMPKKNGYEVCQAIKTDPSLQSTPVLLLAGTFEAFDENRAKEVGADGHITKPFESQALIDKVNDLLSGTSVAQPSTQPMQEATQQVPPSQQAPSQQAPSQQAPSQQAPSQQVPGAQVPGAQVPGAQVPGAQVPGAQVRQAATQQPPRPVEPIAPATFDPGPIEPKSLEPKPLEPKPLEPKPLEPKPLEPKPLEPKPLEPKPLEPKPLEPEPLEPEPLEPKPLEPEPLDAAPFASSSGLDLDTQTQPPLEPELSTSVDSFEPPPVFGDNPTPSPAPAVEPETFAPEPVEPVEESDSKPEPSLDIEEQVPVDLSPELSQDATDSIDDLPAVDIDESGLSDESPELAPMHDFIPNADEVGEPVKDLGPENPEPLDIESDEDKVEPMAASLPKQDLERIAREVLEKIAWEIVPQLAETIIREEIEKLVQEKLSD